MSMLQPVAKYWYLFWKFRQLHVLRTLEFRANFWFWSVVALMWSVFNFFFFYLIAGAKGSIGGWTEPEIYLLLSFYTILDAFIWSFMHHNMIEYTRAVFNGELNRFLLLPVDTQFVVMTYGNTYNQIFRLILGICLLAWSWRLLEIPFSLTILLMVILLLCSSFIFLYSLWFMLSTLSFWVEKLDNINEIVPNIRTIFQVPRTVYQGVISTMLTIIVPIALITSLPSELILGRASGNLIAYFLVFSGSMLLLSRWFFHYSLKKYTGIAN